MGEKLSGHSDPQRKGASWQMWAWARLFLSFPMNRVVFLTVLEQGAREQTCKAKCKPSILIWMKALIDGLWAGSKEKISPFNLLHVLILDKQGLNSDYSWALIDRVSFLRHRRPFVNHLMNKLTASEYMNKIIIIFCNVGISLIHDWCNSFIGYFCSFSFVLWSFWFTGHFRLWIIILWY